MSGPGELRNPTGRLPELFLEPAGGGKPLSVRPGKRRLPILVLVHHDECPDCLAYLEQLSLRGSEVEEWNGLMLAISSPLEGSPSAEPLPLDFPHLHDPGLELSRALGVVTPALVIADSWGEIALQQDAGARHDFPSIDEVVEWARFLDMSCPECEGEAF